MEIGMVSNNGCFHYSLSKENELCLVPKCLIIALNVQVCSLISLDSRHLVSGSLALVSLNLT